MWHLLTACDILALVSAAVCGLLQCTVAPTARCPVCLGSVSPVTEPQGCRGAPIQSCLPSDKGGLYVHAWFAGLFVCMPACLCRADFQEKSRDRKSGTAVKYVFSDLLWLGDSASVLVFELSQSKVAWQMPPFVIFSLVDSDGSLCQVDLLQSDKGVFGTGSELQTHQGHSLQLQTEIHYSSRHTDLDSLALGFALLCPPTVPEICWTETQSFWFPSFKLDMRLTQELWGF